jgi:hypothetical protein
MIRKLLIRLITLVFHPEIMRELGELGVLGPTIHGLVHSCVFISFL